MPKVNRSFPAYLTFNALDSAFELSGGVQERASVSVGYSVLADAMGLSAGRASEGNPAQTPLEAFNVAEQVSTPSAAPHF